MLIVVEEGGRQRLVEIAVHDRGATFDHVAEAASLDHSNGWWVDGCVIEPSSKIEGLVSHGSVVSDTEPVKDPIDSAGLFLEQIAGSDVGWVRQLRRGPNVLGRSPDVELVRDDSSTSGRHCRIERSDDDSVIVTDLGSRNGTRVGGRRVEQAELDVGQLLWAGNGVYRLRRFESQRPFLAASETGEFGCLSFNRPPRQNLVEPRKAVDAPEITSGHVAPSPTLSIAAILAPIVMAAAMVLVLGGLRFVLFALLSPVIAVATWFENRHRARRSEASRSERTAAAVREFEASVEDELVLEHRRRWIEQPDAADLLRWLRGPSTRLWERRGRDADAMEIAVGVGDVEWSPEVIGSFDATVHGARSSPTLADVPISVDIGPGHVVGIVGPVDVARSIGRALLLGAAATSGPSDLRTVVIASETAIHDWGWAAWLPHAADDDALLGRPWVIRADELGAAADALAALPVRAFGLIAIDAPSATSMRNSVARQLFSRRSDAWGGIVVAEREDQLPSECTCVVTIDDDSGRATVRLPRVGVAVHDVQTAGVTRERAVVAARACARLEDPDVPPGASSLPASVALGDVVGAEALSGRSSLRSLPCVLGVGRGGPLSIDLVAEGPHALIAGTTGSGKSELLRTLVTSLAMNTSPRELNFVLIDYKGGSAFDAAADLPHVAGIVTDLDEHLCRRALVCLEAELEYRERALRATGIGDIADVTDSALARLVVVIDEFATLAAELPDFLDSLVSIAQRGRSLGVHLVLATQRPAGAVSDKIRANTNLRICLRVQDAADSIDVIGVDDALRLPRSVPGRALARLGHADTVLFQSAHVTGATVGTRPRPVELAGSAADPAGISTLDKVLGDPSRWVDSWGGLELRRPWPDPVPTRIGARELRDLAIDSREGARIDVAIGDDPERQRWVPFGWDLTVGNLLVLGSHGSGAADALDLLVATAATRWSPSELHVHRIELLAPGDSRSEFPHEAGVVGRGDDEKLSQLVHRHVSAIERRVVSGQREEPLLLLVIDDLGGLLHDQQSAGGIAVVESLRRVWTDGPAVGVHMAVAADRAGAVPTAWSSSVAQKWLFRLADPGDYQMVGLRSGDLPSFIRGRGVDALGVEFQLIDPTTLDSPIVGPEDAGPRPLRSLSEGVGRAELPVASVVSHPWSVPVGLDLTTLDVVALQVHEGEHVLIAGPARSGVSSALGLVGAQLASSHNILALCHGSVADARNARFVTSLGGILAHDSIESAMSALASAIEPCVLVIDDADRFGDEIEALLASDRVGCVVAGGRTDQLRSRFGHWTSYSRSSRSGLLLRPDVDLDGDLFRLRLNRSARRPDRPGSGAVIVEGVDRVIQVAI